MSIAQRNSTRSWVAAQCQIAQRGNAFRVVQFTPPGSGSSIQFGVNLTSAAPGSAQGMLLAQELSEAELLDRIQAATVQRVAKPSISSSLSCVKRQMAPIRSNDFCSPLSRPPL